MEFGSTRGKVQKMSTETAPEDIISSKLPESVISHILSFLPTKEAVRTCVLSKRWIHRWTSITTLDLNDSELCLYPPICCVCKTNCISTCYEYVEDDMTLCRWCFLLPKHDRFHKPPGKRVYTAKRVYIDKETGGKYQQVLTQVDIPVFPNLSHLELNLVTVEVLIGLLQKLPLIKTLVLKGIPKFAKEILSSTVVPDSLASSLQVVKFEQVNGEEHELFLANFFMENGMMLEKVGFSLARDKTKVMEEFKEKMYSFKKGFSFAVVEL